MKARVTFVVEWELGKAEEYPDEVDNWWGAIAEDLRRMTIHNLLQFDVTDEREVPVSGRPTNWEVLQKIDEGEWSCSEPIRVKFERPIEDSDDQPSLWSVG